MKRRVRRLFLTSLLAVLLAALLFTLLMTTLQFFSLRNSLRAVLSAASAWTLDSTSDLNTLAEEIARSFPPLRVTFLLPEGIVLADSMENAGDMSGFVPGGEVREAIERGTGERFSLDGGVFSPSLDMAGLVSGRLLIRLHYPLSQSLLPLLLSLLGIPPLVALLWWVQMRSFDRIQRELDRQLGQVRDLLEWAGDEESAAPGDFFLEIRPAMETICRLIHRMRRDLGEIRKTREIRREFIANASHGLKNPLTAILGFAEILEEGAAETPEKREKYLHAILEEGKRMMAVISDILLLEKQEDKPPAGLEETDLATIANEVAASLLPLCEKTGVTISVSGRAMMPARREDMRELLDNLMGNAVRYNNPGGWVRVLLQQGTVTVSDNGVGIEGDYLPYIFEPFYRVEQPGSGSPAGSGLGLSIAARIANKYGGIIRVESAPGKGSVFLVDFVRNL